MKKTMRNFLENEGLKIVIWGVWLAVNIYLFVDTYCTYRLSDRYHYMYMVLSESICISRACATALNFNIGIILIPMCRTITSFIRTKMLKYIHSNPRRLINRMKGLHIMSAYTICILAVIHTVSHLVNCMRFRLNFTDSITGINAGASKNGTTLWWFLSELPGYTGLAMLLCLLIVVCSSFQAVRRQRYELFWYTHHFALVFIVMSCFHGLGGITKYQINLDKHPRACHDINKKSWETGNNTLCKEPPIFTSNEATTWKWVVGPLFLYIIDRIIRLYRSTRNCKIARVILHEGKVIELHMLKKGFKAKPGGYILLQCPDIAEFEWHAFTLTKVPTSKSGDGATFSVNIKVTGNWTEKLKALICESDGVNDDAGIQIKRVGDSRIIHVDDEKHIAGLPGNLPVIRVDGPYGSPNEDCFRYPVNVSVAAGIGITPFACVLNYLKYLDPTALNKNFKMKRIYLIWVCRDIREFTWFLELMSDTIKHLEEINMADMLVCQLYVTREAKLSEDDPSMMDYKMQWFQKRLQYGRPKFDDILAKIALNYYKQRIGVFFCGPNPLAHILYQSCVKTKHRGNSFIFHKESFA